jgi:Flp pilus assembly protein TadD
MLRRQLMKEIADRLRLIGKKDLYDFLDRPRNSKLAVLQDRTRKLDAEIRNIDQKTAEVTARGELAGHCLSIFKTHQERARYDNALDHQRLSDLLDPVLKTAGAGGVLEANVVTNLLRRAQEAGIAVAEADAYVKEFAKKRGLSVQFTPEPEPPQPKPPDEGQPQPSGPEEKPRGLRPEVLRPAVGLGVCGVAIVCAVLFWPGGGPSEPVPSPAVEPGPLNPGGPDHEISDDERDPPSAPIRRGPRRPPRQMTAEDWLARGRGHHAAGRFADAIAAFDTAIQLDATLAEAYYWRGVIHAEGNRWEQAMADCSAALRLNPDYAEAYHQRGLAHKRKQDWDRAIADYEEAVRRKPALGPDPQFAEPYYRRGLRCKEAQEWDQAVADYEEAVRLDATIAPQPDRQFAEAYYRRGLSRKKLAVANRSLSDLNAAIDDFTKAISLDPEDPRAYASRSLAYYDKGETTKADYDYQRAKQLGYGRDDP